MAKRNPIINRSEVITTTTSKKVTYPIWKLFGNDTQAVRFNAKEATFSFSFDPDNDEWKSMEWEYFLSNANADMTKKDVVEVLENLLALVKATK